MECSKVRNINFWTDENIFTKTTWMALSNIWYQIPIARISWCTNELPQKKHQRVRVRVKVVP